jgi:hypothetical protein
MKTACLLLLTTRLVTIGSGLRHGIAYAAASSPGFQQASSESGAATESHHPGDTSHGSPPTSAKDQKNGKPSNEERHAHHISKKNLAPSHASFTKANRSTQFPNNRERSASANAVNSRQQAFAKSGGAAKGGFIQSEKVKSNVAVRPPSVVRPAVATLSHARHRGPNPAVVGGSANSDRTNTGAINGTRMNRKP